MIGSSRTHFLYLRILDEKCPLGSIPFARLKFPNERELTMNIGFLTNCKLGIVCSDI